MQKGMTIAACAALLGMAAITQADADGRSWGRGASYTGPRGNTRTYQGTFEYPC